MRLGKNCFSPKLILKADAQGDERKKNEEVAKLLKNGKIVHIEGARHNVRRDQNVNGRVKTSQQWAG